MCERIELKESPLVPLLSFPPFLKQHNNSARIMTFPKNQSCLSCTDHPKGLEILPGIYFLLLLAELSHDIFLLKLIFDFSRLVICFANAISPPVCIVSNCSKSVINAWSFSKYQSHAHYSLLARRGGEQIWFSKISTSINMLGKSAFALELKSWLCH